MTISAVSGVSFRGVNPKENLARPGAFTKPETPVVDAPAVKPRKKHTVLKLLLGAAAVAGALVAAAKLGPNTFKVLKGEELANAKFFQKVASYIGTAGNEIAKFCVETVPNFFKGLIHSKAAADATDAIS